MWTVSITSAQYADEKLASLSIESPANLHTSEGLGLLVGLWCGKLYDRIQTDEGVLKFAVGFQIGEVVVEPKGGQISNRGRLQTTGGHLKIVQSDVSQAKKHGAAGGQLGINFTKWIGSLAKADADVGGRLERTVSHTEQKNHEYTQHYWRVADAGHNFWRVYGLGLNQENVLEHKIIGDEPLCHILPDLDSSSIEVTVTFRCSLKDLWFQRTGGIPAPVDSRFDPNQSELNRAAVAARIAALALGRAANISKSASLEDDIILARQILKAARKKRGTSRNG
jgi:hypothetical protein